MSTRPFNPVQFLALLIGVVIILFFLFILISYIKIWYVERLLKKNGFYIFQYNHSLKAIIIESFKLSIVALSTHAHYRIKQFDTIQARTLKNKSLLIVQESATSMPKYHIVYVLKNQKWVFPSFKLTRNPLEKVSVPKNIDERDITQYYTLSTQRRELVLSKLQKQRMKQYYKNIVHQAFDIEYDQKIQTLTVICDRYKTALNQVIHFLNTLDEELEDYIEPSTTIESQEKQLLSKNEIIVPNSFKIYNAISLVNINDVSIKCLVCWSKIDYSTETLLFECCTGYTHIDHGLDWLQNNEKCPKCGTKKPYTIQLPNLSLT